MPASTWICAVLRTATPAYSAGGQDERQLRAAQDDRLDAVAVAHPADQRHEPFPRGFPDDAGQELVHVDVVDLVLLGALRRDDVDAHRPEPMRDRGSACITNRVPIRPDAPEPATLRDLARHLDDVDERDRGRRTDPVVGEMGRIRGQQRGSRSGAG